MTRHERVRYEMLLRIRDFGTAHRELFPESLSGQRAFADVGRAIEQIEAHSTARLTAGRESRRSKAARRAAMLDRMRAIARTSKGVRTAAGTALALPMPVRKADVAVLTAARSFLSEAEAHHDQFISLGLPPTCSSELREAADAFDAALADRRAGRSTTAAAQAGIRAALTLGAKAARTLDIVVVNTVGHDPVLIAAWRRDRTIVEGKGQGGATPGSGDAAPAIVATMPAAEASDDAPAQAHTTDDPLRRVS